jgi:hypothetical protein
MRGTHRLPNELMRALPVEQVDVAALSDRAGFVPHQGGEHRGAMPRLITRFANARRVEWNVPRCPR